MSVSGTNAPSSNSSESFCSTSPPLQIANPQDQQQGYYHPQFNNPQQYHHGYYDPQYAYQNQQQQPQWPNNSTQAPSTNTVIPSQHYYPYPYNEQHYPQQQQQQSQHPAALLNLSRFVQQQQTTLSQDPCSSSQAMPSNPRGNHPLSASSSSASSTAAPSTTSNQMIPVRFQNMTKGARTKASMKKLNREQGEASNDAAKASKKSPKRKSDEKMAAIRAARNSYDEAIEAALLIDEGNPNVKVEGSKKSPNRGKKTSKSPAKQTPTPTPTPSKKKRTSSVENAVANTLLDLKRGLSPAKKIENPPSEGETETTAPKKKSRSRRKCSVDADGNPQPSLPRKRGRPRSSGEKSKYIRRLERSQTKGKVGVARQRKSTKSGKSQPAATATTAPGVAVTEIIPSDLDDAFQNVEVIDTTAPPIIPSIKLPTSPKKSKTPTLWVKRPTSPPATQEKIVGPTLKVVRGNVTFFRGGTEEDMDEPMRRLNPRDRTQKEYDDDIPWECRFCGLGPLEMKLGDLFGPYYVQGKNCDKIETWVHLDCALWAGEVIHVGSTLRGLDEALAQADKLNCTVCGKTGATIGCLSKDCTTCVHFPCGKLNDWSLDYKTFHTYCREHSAQGFSSLYSGLQ